ncbi:MAG TPA: hypothetical protein VG435_11045 [Acidimicrobiales bacterium]|jgi:hypothetical protein|nr:hypothetical protein [Acidimicrobiales bacterium]
MNRDHEASQSPGRSTTGKSSGGARQSGTPRNRSGAVMNLQRAAGNRAVAGMMSTSKTPVQRISAEPVVVQREIKDEDLEFYLGTSDSDEVTRMLAGAVRKSSKKSATKEMPDRDDETTTSGTKSGTKKAGTKKKRSELVKKKKSTDDELAPKTQEEIDKKARVEFVKKQNKEKEQIATYNLEKEQSAKEIREAWAKNQDAILNGGQNPFNRNKPGSWLDRRKPGANQKTANKWLEMTKKKKEED